jgi:hypothetical protein
MTKDPNCMERKKFIYISLGAVILALGGLAAYFDKTTGSG